MTELKAPLVVINFKVYREVEGHKAMEIARACEEVAAETSATIVLCPPLVELARVASLTKLPVFSQHVDAKTPGANTGWVTPTGAKAAGALGTLLNHSEHRLMMYDIAHAVKVCKDAGLISLVCADSAQTAQVIASYEPDYIAVEPPELIGGDISVTDAKPQVILESVEAVHRVSPGMPVLCGAGVKSGKDVKKAIELGAKGVLLASGVVKSKDVKATLRDLVAQF